MEARNIPVDHDLVRSLLNRLEKGCYEKILAEHKEEEARSAAWAHPPGRRITGKESPAPGFRFSGPRTAQWTCC